MKPPPSSPALSSEFPLTASSKSPDVSESRRELNSFIPDHELFRRIGRGSYGEVWLARNVFGGYRAVKIVWRREFGDDNRPFQREFEGIQRFEPISRSHPSQLAILHVGKNDALGCFYYVMELADNIASAKSETRNPKEIRTPNVETTAARGEVGSSGFGLPSELGPRNSDLYTPRTLRLELTQRGALPIERVLELGLALTTALEHLHKHGLVHRDIKPSNIIFVGGLPKLADIGLVTDAAAGDDTRSIVGTEGCLAPEGPGRPQADLFALGKVLYEAATGLDRRQFP